MNEKQNTNERRLCNRSSKRQQTRNYELLNNEPKKLH